jgi:aldehyde dehydrogenase (NAD+)
MRPPPPAGVYASDRCPALLRAASAHRTAGGILAPGSPESPEENLVAVAVAPDPQPRTELAAIPALVARARAAFESGRTRPLEWRRAQLERLEALLSENADELVAALQADLGKPTFEAWTADVGAAKLEAVLARKNLQRWTRPERVRTSAGVWPARSRLVREPLGVVLVIAPWNYPVQLLFSPVAGAFAAGNAVVMKPSEVTPHTSAALAKLVPRYLDPEAVALVEGGVEETTALLAERFDHVFYTGNGRVAQVVMAAAAAHLTPVTLELGGKSPCIVADDADLALAARRIAWGKWLNAGQTCIAPDYVLVPPSREQELVDRIAAAVRGFYGDDPKRSPDYGRIVSARHHARLAALLRDGEVAFGGQSDPAERYIAPTVLRNVAPDAPIMREEIFGPLLPVLTVPDVDAAIEFVVRRDKPLALYVFTNDPALEERVVARTSSGGVCVNGTILHIGNPALPFGGVGPSGMGAYHGRHTFEAFSHRKAVVTKARWLDPGFVYPPYGRLKTALVKRFLG